MEELFVAVCSIIVIILVILGVRNRRRIRGHELNDSSIDNIEKFNLYMSNTSYILNEDRFMAELSKAGFSLETIQDMHAKVLEMKGSVSVSDALAIIRALEPIMKIRKGDSGEH
ncbi:MAG: hypothetical protein AB9866_03925 [Syntrophobacteraceae bacterium]